MKVVFNLIKLWSILISKDVQNYTHYTAQDKSYIRQLFNINTYKYYVF